MNNKIYTIEEIKKIISPIAASHGIEKFFCLVHMHAEKQRLKVTLIFRLDSMLCTEYKNIQPPLEFGERYRHKVLKGGDG